MEQIKSISHIQEQSDAIIESSRRTGVFPDPLSQEDIKIKLQNTLIGQLPTQLAYCTLILKNQNQYSY
jgi:hypothetical protein